MVNVPVGISEYELNNLIPEDYKSSMPTIEEIEKYFCLDAESIAKDISKKICVQEKEI